MKMTRKKSKKKEVSEESQWYRMKMARYYEEEWDRLFKKKSRAMQKVILHEPQDRVSIAFAKEVIKAAEVRDWDDDNPNSHNKGY